ncbi:MAG: hypothetical protein J6M55_00410 [Paludibacteraceae bacterium]|nr:hypothetical protein [Paludibacteraceae bacterium]
MRKILYILTSLLLLASCEQQSELVTLMSIDNVDWFHNTIPSGTNLHFNIFAESKSSPVQRLIMTTDDPEFQNTTILDTALAIPVKKVNMSWYHALAHYSDTTKVKFTLRSYDQSGNTMSYSITMRVAAGAKALRPIDNITLYAAASGGKSAFDINTCQPMYRADTDSTFVGFYDVIDSLALETMTCSWRSETGILFSRSEGFNFSEATVQSLTQAWPNYMKSATIKALKADDVLLIGYTDRPVGVAKILAVIDEEGRTNDRYIFSLKVIPN